MDNNVLVTPTRRSRGIDLSICALYFINDRRQNQYMGDETFPIQEDRLKTYIAEHIWDIWSEIVRDNINVLSHSDSFDEVCHKLQRMKIDGIGAEAIISTAAQIAYKYELPIDDSCWHIGYLQRASVFRLIRSYNADPLEFCLDNIPQFERLDPSERVLCVIRYADLIKMYIRYGCR